MRCLAIVIVLLAVAVPARAQWKSVEPVEIKGAYGLIIVPEDWNGSLFIYAHGYSADQRLITPFPADLTLGNFLGEGEHAVPGDPDPDADRLRLGDDHVPYARLEREGLDQGPREPAPVLRKKYGKPKRTYLWGHSGGGMVTSTLAPR